MVKPPCKCEGQEWLKVSLSVRKFFPTEWEWKCFKNDAEFASKTQPTRFFTNINELSAKVLVEYGWEVEEYQVPKCSCGYCEKCHDGELADMLEEVPTEDLIMIIAMERLKEEIDLKMKKLSEPGKNYWMKKYPAASIVVG